MNNAGNILFVLGPSGAGKTSLGQHLDKNYGWLHLEVDLPDRDGIDAHGLRGQWDPFWESFSPDSLAREIRQRTASDGKRGCVVSFSSLLVLSPKHICAAEKVLIKTIYLYGTAAHCIDSFLQREQVSGRCLSLDHWLYYNKEHYMEMSRPEYAPYRIPVFDGRGSRRPYEEVLDDIQKQSGFQLL